MSVEEESETLAWVWCTTLNPLVGQIYTRIGGGQRTSLFSANLMPMDGCDIPQKKKKKMPMLDGLQSKTHQRAAPA